jgi:hypothetical protein
MPSYKARKKAVRANSKKGKANLKAAETRKANAVKGGKSIQSEELIASDLSSTAVQSLTSGNRPLTPTSSTRTASFVINTPFRLRERDTTQTKSSPQMPLLPSSIPDRYQQGDVDQDEYGSDVDFSQAAKSDIDEYGSEVAFESIEDDIVLGFGEISTALLSTLHVCVDKARTMPLQQVTVLWHCMRRILRYHEPDSRREPKEHQVYVLRRMIYGNSDTLFIAKTGYGKSIIFQAYSILTRRITIQIIPLVKLGEEQCRDIASLDSTAPCLVTAQTKKEK